MIVYTPHYAYTITDWILGHFGFCRFVIIQTTFLCTFSCLSSVHTSTRFCVYLGVESLGHKVCVSPSLIEAVTLCSKTCGPVSCHWRVHIATQPHHHLLLSVCPSASLVVVVASISLWLTHEVENFFKCLVTIWIFSALSSGLMFCFVLFCPSPFYTFRKRALCHVYCANILSHPGLPFPSAVFFKRFLLHNLKK